MREWGQDRTEAASKRWLSNATGVGLALLVAVLLLWPLLG